jgi:hypothetical protein
MRSWLEGWQCGLLHITVPDAAILDVGRHDGLGAVTCASGAFVLWT